MLDATESPSKPRLVGVFDARLTAARFLGDVNVSADASDLLLTGPRARLMWSWRVSLVPWLLVAIGIAGLVSGVVELAWALAVAGLVAVFGYLAKWYTAVDETVRIPVYLVERPRIGLRSGISGWLAMSGPLGFLTGPWLGARTLSFSAPLPGDVTSRVDFVLVAPQPAVAEALLNAIIDRDLSELPDAS